jgi:hypothetical protein
MMVVQHCVLAYEGIDLSFPMGAHINMIKAVITPKLDREQPSSPCIVKSTNVAFAIVVSGIFDDHCSSIWYMVEEEDGKAVVQKQATADTNGIENSFV